MRGSGSAVLGALLLVSAARAAEPRLFFQVIGTEAGSWPEVLGSLGFQPQAGAGPGSIFILRAGSAEAGEPWLARAASGAFLILEGQSAAAEAAGFRAGRRTVRVRNIEELRRPQLDVIWQQGLELPVFELPTNARVFARERWSAAPLVAGFRHGAGAVLWVAASPGKRGHERFPYLLHALADLGLEPPFQARRLWAFFDSAYRARVDLDYLAARWRASGIAALHAAAWHHWEPDQDRDRYLEALIRACHRNGILVYAWLELPHVSEKFWDDHPEWREQTALLQDARLDWRKLMNLTNRDCFRTVAAGVAALIRRFDWDGVNVAELYFESLEGAANPSRFTPMNPDVRREFREAHGFDPLELFGGDSRPERLRRFLDFRAALAARIEQEWLAEIEGLRRSRPDLDLVLTHVDDRFDTGMRDAIGADSARALPLLERHDFTFLVEDPATVWNLGPQRYPEIARRYALLTPRTGRLGIDINVVERYQDVYPTKQQTGTELFQMLRLAALSFSRVTLYFENSVLAPDLPLLPAATAAVTRVTRIGTALAVESKAGVGVPWNGPALVDGRLWPVADGSAVWLPQGAHVVDRAAKEPPLRLVDFNGELKAAAVRGNAVEFAYYGAGRALAVLDRRPQRIEIDGAGVEPVLLDSPGGRHVLVLPRGQHLAVLE